MKLVPIQEFFESRFESEHRRTNPETLEDESKFYKEFTESVNRTKDILYVAKSFGVTLVSIGVSTGRIEGCKEFPFNPTGSLFCNGYTEGGRPIAWEITDKLGYRGCGNRTQHQLVRTDGGQAPLTALYEFKDGEWYANVRW